LPQKIAARKNRNQKELNRKERKERKEETS